MSLQVSLLIAAGIPAALVAVLFFFLLRLRHEKSISRNRLDLIRASVTELRQRLKQREQETEILHEKLRDEVARRAAAEQRIERLGELKSEYNALWAERIELLQESRQLSAEIAALRATMTEEKKQNREKLRFLDEAREKLDKEFRLIAERIFTEKNRIFTEQSRESLEVLLSPMREQLAAFREKVEKSYELESRDRVSLTQEIRSLKTINERISSDALNLASALRGENRTQGAWGEMVLEKLLEDSGLRPGRDFVSQKSFRNHTGRILRPDVIIHLPGGRDLVIDAKMSLKSYEQSTLAADRSQRDRYLAAHLTSLRNHISGLSKKQYDELPEIRTLDFVLLFIPVDGAYIATLQFEPEILSEAMRKNVMLTGPSTLLVILRTINHMWKQREVNRNARSIALQAGSLYDKFIGFVEAMDAIGQRLQQTREAWETARNRLAYGQGNVISKLESFKKLGIQTKKTLPSTFDDYHVSIEGEKRSASDMTE